MCLEVHRLHAIYHHHAPTALGGGLIHEARDQPRRIHIDIVALAVTAQRIGINGQQIRMAFGSDTAKDGMRRIKE